MRTRLLTTFLALALFAPHGVAAAVSEGEVDLCEARPENWPVHSSELVDQPDVTGPVTGGIRGGEPYGRTLIELADGWVEEEFFYAGTARRSNGDTEEYTTRILVRRPTDCAEFNGTVVLDWVNVTIPDDTDVSWPPMAGSIMERGFAYVAVTAQRLGVDSPTGLRFWDPVRYSALSHPGDDYSFDMFAQAAEAVLDEAVLGELRPKVQHRLALGASQSAGRLRTFVNSWHDATEVFDGYMPQISSPSGLDRDTAPVLWLNSQDEIGGGGHPEDSEQFRLWEVAGPAHTTNEYHQYVLATYGYAQSNGTVNAYDPEDAGAWGYQDLHGRCLFFNYYPVSYAWSAALVALDDWVRTGEAPEPMPRAERSGGSLVYDEHGNLRGGIRNPVLDVPIATYYAGTGGPAPGHSDACAQFGARFPLSGTTRMFEAEQLHALYPTAETFLDQFSAAIESSLDAGFLLPEGAEELRRRAPDAAAFVAGA